MYTAKKFTAADLESIGFTVSEDKEKDPRGTCYNYENEQFRIWIDAWGDAKLMRRNPDTDYIDVLVNDRFDIEQLIDFINPAQQ